MDIKTMKRLLARWLVYGLLLVGGALVSRLSQPAGSITAVPAQHQPLPPGYYRVVEVYDGDTIGIDMEGTIEKIRFIGVDTPETQHPSKPVGCFGPEATVFTRKLIDNNPVRLEADPINSNRDRYSRLLRYVYLPDGTLLNRTIVEKGYGYAYTAFEFSKADDFISAETAAQQKNSGLWGACR